MAKALGLDDLVANRTMSREIAEMLRTAARERKSLLVVAIPRLAGKSTVLNAILAERPRSAPVKIIAEDGDDLDDLMRRSAGGYLVIPEITQSAAMPGYIWGAPVRRLFKGIGDRVALAATLHADGVADAFAQICEGCKVPDADASKVQVAVYLRSIGHWEAPARRVVDSVHEIVSVRDGRAHTRELFHWDEESDDFV